MRIVNIRHTLRLPAEDSDSFYRNVDVVATAEIYPPIAAENDFGVALSPAEQVSGDILEVWRVDSNGHQVEKLDLEALGEEAMADLYDALFEEYPDG